MRILIVEDNKKLAEVVKHGLEKEGFAVDYLLDGESGEKRMLINHQDYDLLILDVMLPKKDGIAVCRTLRESGITTPILMLTAKVTTEDKVFGLDSGADDYLAKPFSFSELVARIRALLRRPPEAISEELRAKDLTLNTITRSVARGERKIPLTLKEFMVLEYMLRHQNEVISREQLYDHAWDFAAVPFSNTVDVHLKNLRKKIDNEHDEKLLETVRGVGYRLKA
ncbi:MAG: response regulator transcription factor [Patescibacteria group bacterium]|nr:response regulator transcription factor [Patescibacteria group bacterium]